MDHTIGNMPAGHHTQCDVHSRTGPSKKRFPPASVYMFYAGADSACALTPDVFVMGRWMTLHIVVE